MDALHFALSLKSNAFLMKYINACIDPLLLELVFVYIYYHILALHNIVHVYNTLALLLFVSDKFTSLIQKILLVVPQDSEIEW